MSIRPIDLNLLEKSEIGLELFTHKLTNLLIASPLLPIKLVSRESQDLKTSSTQLIVQLSESLVVR